VLLPYGELELIAPAIINMAKRATVPVVVHYDHGLTFERCIEALRLGFTSVMFDGSAGDPSENLKATAEIVKIAHAFGATVEGEIGHVGDAGNNEQDIDDMYTTPGEAKNFVEATGVDALAIAIGTAHGVYKTKPKLDIERLKQIRAAIDTPLVLHGGSGLTDDDFRDTVRNGISKVNIFTDLCVAADRAIAENLGDKSGFNEYLTRRKIKVEAMKKAAMEKMILFGSNGRV
jgi:fructose-bisphosphate aldolase class II